MATNSDLASDINVLSIEDDEGHPRNILLDDMAVEDCNFVINSVIEVIDLEKIKIIVKTRDNRDIEIEARKSYRIIDLWPKIKEKVPFDENMHGLQFGDSILEYDGVALETYRIKENSVLRIIDKSRSLIRLHAKMCCGRVIDIEVTKNCRIKEVKTKIENEIATRDKIHIHLKYTGLILEKGRTIDYYHIPDNAVINIVDHLRDFRIFVEVKEECIIPIDVCGSDKISDVKDKIREKKDLVHIELFYQGQKLLDNKSLMEYRIKNNCSLSVCNDGISLTINTMDGRRFCIEIQKHQKISYLKTNIFNVLHVPPDAQRLVYQGKILENEKSVLEYNIENHGEVVFIEIFRDYTICIRSTSGRTFFFNVTSNLKIIELKTMMYLKSGFPELEQVLEFQGTILDDKKCIDHYNIVNNCIINDVSTFRRHTRVTLNKSGYESTIYVPKGEQLGTIKSSISNIDQEVLIYKDNILSDSYCFHGNTEELFKFYCDDAIDVVKSNEIHIHAIFQSKPVRIIASNIDRLIDLKSKIMSKIDLPIEEQILEYKGKILRDDSARLYKYGINQNCSVDVLDKSIYLSKLRIQTSEYSFSLEVSKKDRIIDIKRKIKEKTGIQVQQQRLEHILLSDEDDNIVETQFDNPAFGQENMVSRGLCCIINNESFLDGRKRNGSDKDEENIILTFEDLGYTVEVYKDIESTDMDGIISKIKAKVDRRHRMLIIFILSHGEKGEIIFTDNKPLQFERIWNPFTNKSFPTFNGKPKVFFFVCCQGNNDMCGIEQFDNSKEGGESTMEFDGDECVRRKFPEMANLFFGYSTVENYKSSRDKFLGTIYIDKLCYVLRNNSKWSICDIHQEVQKEVSANSITKTKEFYQMPYFTNILTEHAYL